MSRRGWNRRSPAAPAQCAPGAAPGAVATADIGADDMIRLISGGVGRPELLATRRLTLSGDPFLDLRFPGLFQLPLG